MATIRGVLIQIKALGELFYTKVIIVVVKNIKKAMGRKKRKTMKKTYVPPEIVREIFLRLPCKSLRRFRSACKQYKSHVDDIQFMEEHRKINTKALHFLTWGATQFPSNLHLFEMGMDTYAHIKAIPIYNYEFMLPSSYGMVCLHGRVNKKIALFNPSREDIIPLPDLVEPAELNMNRLGFGFDPKSRRYKIVQLIFSNLYLLRFHILTVTHNDSSWRTANVPNRPLHCCLYHDPKCVDGVLYWEMWISCYAGYIGVLVFDLGSEDVKLIKSPAKRRGDSYGFGGHLALLDGGLCCYDMTPPTMNIWKLKHDFENNVIDWTLWCKLEICGLNSELPPLIPVYFYEDRRILLQDVFTKGFYCYGIEDKSLKIYPSVGKDALRIIARSETNSLVSTSDCYCFFPPSFPCQ